MRSIRNTAVRLKYELIFLGIFAYYFIAFVPGVTEVLQDYCVEFYFITYDFGFISRGLIGSLLSLIFPFLTQRALYFIIAAALILLSIVTARFLGGIIRKSDKNLKNVLAYLAVLFCVNPASLSFLFSWENFGRLDIWLLIITIVCLLLITKNKALFLVPVFCAAAVMIHQNFIFLYFPLIFILLAYRAALTSRSRKNTVICIITGALTCAGFVYFQFFGKIQRLSMETALQMMQSRTNYPVSVGPLQFEHYAPFKQHIDLLSEQGPLLLIKLAIVLVIFLPLIFIFVKLWRAALKSVTRSRWIYIGFLLVLPAALPIFITVDWGRWLAHIIIGQFLLIFCLSAMNDEPMTKSLRLTGAFMERHRFAFLCIAAFLALPGKLTAAGVMNTPLSEIGAFGKNILALFGRL
ncbi:MAG TPA: hypothetical protein DEQ02_10210 [Ruminococcaceae bacterium]|nr:hypothetical protein [Oscillospiraceae bacterium]